MNLSFKEVLSVSLILFSVIDIPGSIPVIIDLKKKAGSISAGKATIVAGVLMVIFLILGQEILGLFGIDVSSFAIAGGLIIFFLGIEMVLGITLFRGDEDAAKSSSIVPLAFPLIAGAGTMTTLISLRAEFEQINILIGIVLNLAFVYIVIRSSGRIERILGKSGSNVLRKVFGIILLAIAIKLIKTNLFV